MEPDEYRRIADAEARHWWYRATRALAQQFLAPALSPGARMLDAGCGPGGNSAWWLDHGEVTGVDIAPEAINLARSRHPLLDARRGDLTALPLGDGTFDVALVLTALYMVGDDRAALRELSRVLRPGGTALLLEPAGRRLRRDHDAVTHALRRYSLPDLTDRAEAAGLTVRRATYAYSFLLPPAVGLSLLHRVKSPSRPDLSDLERDRFGGLLGGLARVERRYLEGRDIPAGLSCLVLAEKPA
jgi:ubiquinone/menaquinone biosynthesis C-methylase UbiE